MGEFKKENGTPDERRHNRAEHECRNLERICLNPNRKVEGPSVAMTAALRQKLASGEILTEEEFMMLGSRIAMSMMDSADTFVASHGARLMQRMHARVRYFQTKEKRLHLQATKTKRELAAMKKKAEYREKMRAARKAESEAWQKTHTKGLALPGSQ